MASKVTATAVVGSSSSSNAKAAAKLKLEELSNTIDGLLEREGPRHESASEVCKILMQAFELLFEFQQEGQVDAAKLCGMEIVHVLADFMDAPQVVEQAVLCISTMCSHEEARVALVETTDLLPICIQALSNSGSSPGLREKMLGLVGVFLRGFVKEAMRAGIMTPLLDILNSSENLADIRAAVSLIVGLMEPGDPGVSAKFLFDGGVSLLLQNVARTCPEGASAAEQGSYRYLHTLCLRGIACVLRHQPLARDLSPQFFETNTGRFRLQAIVEHCSALTDVCRWLFAAEILVWLASTPRCRPLLLQLRAKAALRKVVSQGDPYAKWPALSNQSVVAKSLLVLFSCVEERHLLAREQQGFLALWMNRYAAGRSNVVAEDTMRVRTILGLHWSSFGTMMLASADEATRYHAHAALQGLSGESNRRIPDLSKVRFESSSRLDAETNGNQAAMARDADRDHRESVVMMEHILGTVGLENALPPAPLRPEPPKVETTIEVTRKADESTMLLEYLVWPLGLDTNEERQAVRKLLEANLTLPIILRPGVSIKSLSKSIEDLQQVAVGTKLAMIDGITDLREMQAIAKKEVQRMVEFGKTITIHRLDGPVSRRRSSSRPLNGSKQATFMLKASPPIEEEIVTAKCFISFFWKQHGEATVLAQRLERMGISCHVDEDVEQNKTLDFDRVNGVLSGCEIVLCLVTSEYIRSVDSNRELLLATARKKTIIPIVQEHLERWPPRGITAPLLTGKLYINLDDSAPKEAQKRFMALGEALLQFLGLCQRPLDMASTPTPSVTAARRPSNDFMESSEEEVSGSETD